jgi:hypothetical protein
VDGLCDNFVIKHVDVALNAGPWETCLLGFRNSKSDALDRSDSTGVYAAITDVNKPKEPTAVLRGYADDLNKLRVVTINSSPHPLIEGADTPLRTTVGYDNVTGVGTPYIPSFIEALLLY